MLMTFPGLNAHDGCSRDAGWSLFRRDWMAVFIGGDLR
jgi:hypothetical protein